MLTEQTLRELAAYQPGAPVLSVYLNTDPRQGNADAYRLRLRNLLKHTTRSADAEAVRLERAGRCGLLLSRRRFLPRLPAGRPGAG